MQRLREQLRRQWLCKWFGHRKVKIEDNKNQRNLAYCKRCFALYKWDNKEAMFYNSTGLSAVIVKETTGDHKKNCGCNECYCKEFIEDK